MRGPRLSTKAKAFMAIALALLLWAPQGVSTQTQPVVTGHSTFYNGDVYDPCLASIAGILRSRVMWFNDMVLAERYGGKGTFVYVTENGAQDPTKWETLYSEGVFYDFVDPNGAHWHVEEAFADLRGHTPGTSSPGQTVDYVYNQEMLQRDKEYVWIVELSDRPIVDQFAPAYGEQYYHDLYNFLVLVDTCKFKNATAGGYHNIEHSGSEGGHPVNEDGHRHDGYQANIWTGTRPNIAPWIPSEEALAWQSGWATSPQTRNNAASAGQSTANRTTG